MASSKELNEIPMIEELSDESITSDRNMDSSPELNELPMIEGEISDESIIKHFDHYESELMETIEFIHELQNPMLLQKIKNLEMECSQD